MTCELGRTGKETAVALWWDYAKENEKTPENPQLMPCPRFEVEALRIQTLSWKCRAVYNIMIPVLLGGNFFLDSEVRRDSRRRHIYIS